MANEQNRYGPHKYPDNSGGIGECEHGCGCEMHSFSNYHPIGVNAFGECPLNQIEGNPLKDKGAQIERFARERIAKMEQEMHHLREQVSRTNPTKKALGDRVAKLELALRNAANALGYLAQSAMTAVAEANENLK